VTLPALASAPVAPAPPVAVAHPGLSRTLEGIRVLVVEDDFDSAEGLANLLAGEGAVVTVADTCADALEQYRASDPHVLICDIALPDGDGYNLLTQLRALNGRDTPLPAIALTAYAGLEHARRATGSGFQVHFAKPFEAEELVRVVEWLARPMPVET
jgi:CheY-like chemotaxis protein